jgi:hypothetical protein
VAKQRAETPAKRFEQLTREVAGQLKCKLSDPRVEHVATLRLMRENVQARLLLNERVEPSEVLKLDEALRHYMPSSGGTGEPHTIRIEYAETITGICPKCKARIEDYRGPQNSDFPRTIEGEQTLSATPVAPSPKDAPRTSSRSLSTPLIEKVLIEKDSRPNAPANQGVGSVVWSGGPSSTYPLEGTR